MTLLLSTLCLALAAATVAAEWRHHKPAKALFKIAASSCFLLLALKAGALGSQGGQWLLFGLICGWLGDALLLFRRGPGFLLGISAFLLGHLMYTAVFLRLQPELTGLLLGSLLFVPAAILAWRWLRPHLHGVYQKAVPAYLLAIGLMGVAATGIASAQPWLATGAFAFALSDLAVARERFVHASIINRAWGLPLYYAGQLLLAAQAGQL